MKTAITTIIRLGEPDILLLLTEEFCISSNEHFSYFVPVNPTFIFSNPRRRLFPLRPSSLPNQHNPIRADTVVAAVVGLSSLSLVSFENTECVGLFGPEVILLGESFNGDNDRFRSIASKVYKRQRHTSPPFLSRFPLCENFLIAKSISVDNMKLVGWVGEPLLVVLLVRRRQCLLFRLVCGLVASIRLTVDPS